MMSRATANSSSNSKPVMAEPGITSPGLLRRLDQIDRELCDIQQTGNSRWIVPYADLITLLLGLFMVLFILARIDNDKLANDTQTLASEKAVAMQELQNLEQQTAQNRAILKLLEKKLITTPMVGAPIPTSDSSGQLAQILNEQMALDEGSHEGIQITQDERGVVISLQDGILFSPGSADLDMVARTRLDTIAHILKDLSQPIRVEGHTDNTPIRTSRYPSNWELSTDRATGIVRYLMERHGYKPDGLSATGYGEHRPVAKNSSIEGKRKNRRVDIVILNGYAASNEPAAGVSLDKPKGLKQRSGTEGAEI
jgi:chemotaxis protein MotB